MGSWKIRMQRAEQRCGKEHIAYAAQLDHKNPLQIRGHDRPVLGTPKETS
jgi:hypothetical protein